CKVDIVSKGETRLPRYDDANMRIGVDFPDFSREEHCSALADGRTRNFPRSSSGSFVVEKSFQHFPLLLVKLLEQTPLTQVERPPRPVVGRLPLGRVMEAPAGGATCLGARQISKKIANLRLPLRIAAREWFLIVQWYDAADLLHPLQILASLGFRLVGRGGVARAVRADEIETWRLQIFFHLGAAEVAAVGCGHQSRRIELLGT